MTYARTFLHICKGRDVCKQDETFEMKHLFVNICNTSTYLGWYMFEIDCTYLNLFKSVKIGHMYIDFQVSDVYNISDVSRTCSVSSK
jgi:hypothetical protein